MKELFETMEHVEMLQDHNKKLMDDTLDLYKKYPEICTMLLKELIDVEKDVQQLSEELNNFKDEIHKHDIGE